MMLSLNRAKKLLLSAFLVAAGARSEDEASALAKRHPKFGREPSRPHFFAATASSSRLHYKAHMRFSNQSQKLTPLMWYAY
jgi:hypothetical protein